MTLQTILSNLKQNSNFRTLTSLKHEGIFVFKQEQKLLNLAGNDYLNLASSKELKTEFLNSLDAKHCYFSSSSSRSLSGNFEIYEEFENYLKKSFKNKEILHFNSGFTLNFSCIASLASLGKVLFLADKLIHASMIDGLKGAKFLRFKHNDIQGLERLLEKYHKEYELIIILSEALFSMDGDFADIKSLVRLKKSYSNVLLYIDEAHSVGCFDESGLGFVRTLGLQEEVDFLVFTFGKALASSGACMITSKDFKDFFINKARALIYSTALAPINVAWSLFIFKKLENFNEKRRNLAKISAFFLDNLKQKNCEVLGEAHIISLILRTNENALNFAQKLEKNGFFAPAIKEPSVARNTARIRFSLHSDLEQESLMKIAELL